MFSRALEALVLHPCHPHVVVYVLVQVDKVPSITVIVAVSLPAPYALPPAQVGMSGGCYPDALINSIPNLYYYAANNPRYVLRWPQLLCFAPEYWDWWLHNGTAETSGRRRCTFPAQSSYRIILCQEAALRRCFVFTETLCILSRPSSRDPLGTVSQLTTSCCATNMQY